MYSKLFSQLAGIVFRGRSLRTGTKTIAFFRGGKALLPVHLRRKVVRFKRSPLGRASAHTSSFLSEVRENEATASSIIAFLQGLPLPEGMIYSSTRRMVLTTGSSGIGRVYPIAFEPGRITAMRVLFAEEDLAPDLSRPLLELADLLDDFAPAWSTVRAPLMKLIDTNHEIDIVYIPVSQVNHHFRLQKMLPIDKYFLDLFIN